VSDHSWQQTDTDYYLVVATVRRRLTVNKQRLRKFNMEMFSISELSSVEGKEKYHVEVSNSLQLWKIWTLKPILIVLGKLLERISKFLSKRV
jgi:hypothetical protein